MSATAQEGLTGRSVARISEVREPGDYAAISNSKGAVVALWFILPSGQHARIPAHGHGLVGRGTWSIEVHDDGTVTVDPSISLTLDAGVVWHGFLRRGVWSPA